MPESIQVRPQSVVAYNGDEKYPMELEIFVRPEGVSVQLRAPDMVVPEFDLGVTTFGFLLGSLIRALDPDNLAGMRRPGALDAFPTEGEPEYLQIFDQQHRFVGVAKLLPDPDLPTKGQG